ncbi:MAG: carboxypeptidase-like regulatory domain-containing protein [Planctomycetota bacterium]
MQHRSLLFILVGALLLVAAAALVGAAWRPGAAPPVGDRVGSAPPARPIAEVPAAVDASSPRATADPGREQVAGPATTTAHDPSIEAALCGFRGRVVDHAGAPQADLVVAVYRLAMDAVLIDRFGDDPTEVLEPQIDAGRATTAADGAFEITGIWPQGLYALRAGVEAEVSRLMLLDRSPGPGEIIELGDVRLELTATIAGTAVDEAGVPLAGARVWAIDLPATIASMVALDRFDERGVVIAVEGSGSHVMEIPEWLTERLHDLPIPSTETDAEGHFRLTNVTAGTWMVVVRAAELEPGLVPSVSANAGSETDVGRIELREGDEVRGTVLDAAGQPIAGAQVVVGAMSAMAPVAFGSYAPPTSAAGEFCLGGFRGGRVIAAARRRPGDPWVVGEPAPAGRDLVLRLPATRALTLHITDAEGAPLPSAPRLRLFPSMGSEAGSPLTMGFASPVPVAERLEDLGAGRYRLAPMAVGAYRVEVWADDFAATTVELDLVADGDPEHTLRLTRESRGTVRVRTAAGDPVRSAAVYAMPADSDEAFPLVCGRTDTDGGLALRRLGAGEVELMVHHPAFGWASRSVALPATEDLVFEFAAPGHVRGLCMAGLEPPEPGQWTIVVQRQGSDGPRWLVPRLASADATGAFEVHGLQPGDYRLEPVPSLRSLTSFGGVADLMESAPLMWGAPTASVQVRSGTTAEVRLDVGGTDEVVEGASAKVAGTVLVDGRPGTGMIVSRRWQGRAVTVDEAGRFDLGVVPAGAEYLEIHDPKERSTMTGAALWTRQLTIEENENVELTIDLRLGSIGGMVVRPDGTPAGRCVVTLNGLLEGGGEAERAVATNHVGRFEAPRVPAGTYRLSVDNQDVRGELTDVTLSGGAQLVGTRLVVQPLYTLRGSVDLTSLGAGAPDWAWLDVKAVADGWSHGGSIDDDGSFEVEGLTPGAYTCAIRAFYREAKPDGSWDSRPLDFVHDGTIEVHGDREGVVLRPVPTGGQGDEG